MIKLKTVKEIEVLREGGSRLAFILHHLAGVVKPGMKTIDLEKMARELIDKGGDKPAFLNYKPKGARRPYQSALCVSINEEIVHGIPSDRIIEEGDVVTVDLGLVHQGFFTDMAITVTAGEVSEEIAKLIRVTKESLVIGIKMAQVGNTTGDIGFAIEDFVTKEGFGIVYDLSGHGVGYQVHEDPLVPNFGQKGHGEKLKSGLVIAIEPMVTLDPSDTQSTLESDDFTCSTANGSRSAHFEHTIAITDNGPIILTELR